MVRAELTKDPQITNDVLLKKATAIDGSVRRLSARQFNATYRLPVLRSAKRLLAEKPAPIAAREAGAKQSLASTPAGATPARTLGVEPAQAPAPEQTPSIASDRREPLPESPALRATSTSVARPNGAEREVVRQILQTVAREALATEDRTAFVRLLDSLDQRATMILGAFGRT